MGILVYSFLWGLMLDLHHQPHEQRKITPTEKPRITLNQTPNLQ